MKILHLSEKFQQLNCRLMGRRFGRTESLRARLLVLGIFIVALQGAAFAGDDAPAWLRQAAGTNLPTFGKEVSAVVLFHEGVYKIEEDGKINQTRRYAVKILANNGKSEATGMLIYNTDSEKVKDIRGWLIQPSGEVKKYGKDETLDMALVDNDIFNEVKKKIITASGDAVPGAIFGYEYTVEERSVFTQAQWFFQSDLPVVVSRMVMSLPTGWHAESVTFNYKKIEPSLNGTTYSWEVRDLANLEDEPSSPSVMAIVPRLAVNVFPPEGKATLGKAFASWADVSAWLTDLSAGQDTPSESMAAKARELTANAKTEYEKIQSIGRFVQGVNYVSIQTGLGRGGGYRPHAAVEVFTKSYGDCKDKANLMKAMLKSLGITAYLVSIYSGDPTHVRDEWPSPQQFNHCIIAVKLTEATKAPTVVEHPKLGRLLIFDPTDDTTPVGDLPDHEQNSFALINAGPDGMLMRMPITPPEANRLERTIDVELSVGGAISAKLREESIGQASVDERRRYRGLSRPDYVRMLEKWITRGATGAMLKKAEPTDNLTEGKFSLDIEFDSPHYGQLMQGRLLIFKPAIVSRREMLVLTDGARKQPVLLDSEAYMETVRVKLPEGFAVDELPDAVKMETAFGTYYTNYEVKDGVLHFTRKMILRGAIVPASDYEKVKNFFAAMRAAEQSPVVLAKK